MDQRTVAQRAQDLLTRGYCVLESVHDAAAIEHQKRTLHEEWQRRGAPGLAEFGMGIHPLLEFVPQIAPHLDCPAVNEVLVAAFRGPAQLRHAGARVSNQESSLNIGWHHHYDWDADLIRGRSRVQRVLVGFYVKGASPEIGSLCVIPRAVDDPLGPALGEAQQDWPGQVAVSAPPGSAVIFDTAVYHTALRGSEPGMRYLWGGHYQAWSDPRVHREDNNVSALLEDPNLLDEYPGLKALVLPNAASRDS